MDDIDKIEEYWENLKKQEGYSNDKAKTMKTFINLLKLIEIASQDSKSSESQIIKNFISSSFFTLLNIEEPIFQKSNLSINKLVEYSEQELDNIKRINSKYVQIVDSYIQISSNYNDIEDQVLRAIRRLKESELNIEDKSQIKFKHEWIELAILKFNPDRYPNYRFLTTSEVPCLNALLQFKLHITNELFPFIIAIYKKTNNLGSDSQFILIDHLINIFKKSLIPGKQLQPFANLVLKDTGIKLCKATSDKFAEQMIILLKEKQKAKENILLNEKFRLKFNNTYKELYNSNIINKLVDNYCIPENLKNNFLSLLENDGLVDKPINWTTSDWKLYFIISKFEENKLLNRIRLTSKIEYILNNFTYNGKPFEKHILAKTISRANNKLKENNKYKDFAEALEHIFNSY